MWRSGRESREGRLSRESLYSIQSKPFYGGGYGTKSGFSNGSLVDADCADDPLLVGPTDSCGDPVSCGPFGSLGGIRPLVAVRRVIDESRLHRIAVCALQAGRQ